MTKKTSSLLFIFLAIFLYACSRNETAPSPTGILNPSIPATSTPAYTCSAVEALPTALPSQSLMPPITEADFSIGPIDAAITLVEYCDFQSQGCLAVAQSVAELMRNHPQQIRFVFRPLPLGSVLDKSDLSVQAVFAADEQGNFWELYELLFVRHAEWVNLSPGQFKRWLIQEAPKAKLEAQKFTDALNADGATNRLNEAKEAAAALSIPAVPVLFINGSLQQSYVLDYQNLSDTVGLILMGQKQFTQCPPFTVDANKQYVATIETEKGNVVLQLFPDKAPLAVNSFLFLAQQGWYNGVTFHRVLPGFVAQTGDPSGTGRGNPGYFFKNEISDLRFSKPGMVGMANSGPDTNGSQFFITFAPTPSLDGYYTIFGQVIQGLDVAEQLTPRDPAQGGYLTPGDTIVKIIVDVK